MLSTHTAERRVVTNQVGELGPLLDEVAQRKAVDLLAKVGDAEQVAEDLTGIVEAERLVEIRDDEKVLERCGGHCVRLLIAISTAAHLT